MDFPTLSDFDNYIWQWSVCGTMLCVEDTQGQAAQKDMTCPALAQLM